MPSPAPVARQVLGRGKFDGRSHLDLPSRGHLEPFAKRRRTAVRSVDVSSASVVPTDAGQSVVQT